MRFAPFAVVAMIAVAAPVAAQPASTTKADILFNEGRDLLEAGKFKEACERFEASLKEADALGTRLNLSLCMEKRGRIHSAVVSFDDTAARADREGQPDSAKVAREHADALRPLVPIITFTINSPVPGEKVVISRPGMPDIEITASGPVKLDPTDPNDPTDWITITATAPGHVAYSSDSRTVAVKSRETIEVPALSKLLDPDPRPIQGGKSNRKLYGIISAASGVVLIGASALFANYEQGKLDDYCAAHAGARDSGADCEYDGTKLLTGRLRGDAKTHHNLLRYGATSMFVVGIAGVGLGAYLYFTAPKATESRRTTIVPTVEPGGGGIAVLGHF